MRRLIGMLLCMIFVLSGCSSTPEDLIPPTEPEVVEYQQEEGTPKAGGNLNLGIYGVDSLNPLLTKNAFNAQVLGILFDGLFRVNSDFSLTNRLCESYSSSGDGKSYTFQIRSDVYFHDGTRLTAQDVEYSCRLVATGEGVYRSRFDNVASYRASGNTLMVTLNQPDSNFPAMLDFPIVKRSSYLPDTRNTGDAQADERKTLEPFDCIGTGMFQLQSQQENRSLTLAANPEWAFGSRPYIDTVTIQILPDKQTAIYAFENMEIDVLSSDVIDLREYAPKRNLQRKEYPGRTLCFLGVNPARAQFMTPGARQAMSCLVDRTRIVQDAVGGRAVESTIPIHPASYLFRMDLPYYEYDFNRAKQLIEEDGWRMQDNAFRRTRGEETDTFEANVLVNQENAGRVKAASMISESLTQAGIRSTLQMEDMETYRARIASGDYDLFLGEIALPYNMDLSVLEPYLPMADDGWNAVYGALRSSASDALPSVYAQVEEYLAEYLPLIGVYFANGALLFGEHIKGDIQPTAGSVFSNLEEWYLAE